MPLSKEDVMTQNQHKQTDKKICISEEIFFWYV